MRMGMLDDIKGKVEDVLGSGKDAAQDAVRQWKFNPGMRDGTASQSWVLVPISFKLSDL